jgi:predicted ArsR family transcriptional regulator
MPTLTAGDQRRRDIIKFIKAYHRKNGYAPSIQQIGDHLGIGKTAVRHHLDALQKVGKVAWEPGYGRSIRVL